MTLHVRRGDRSMWLVLLGAIVAATIGLRSEIRPLHSSGRLIALDENFDDSGRSFRAYGWLAGDVSFSHDGLVLLPGRHLELYLPVFTLSIREHPAAQVWLYHAEGVSNSIECSRNGRQFEPVRDNVFGSGEIVPLAPCAGSPYLMLRIRVDRLAGGAVNEALVIDKLQVMSYSGPVTVPGLAALFGCWVLLTIVIAGARLVGAPNVLLVAVASAAILALGGLYREVPGFFGPVSPQLQVAPVMMVATLLLAAFTLRLRTYPEAARTIEFLWVCTILAVGFALRWQRFASQLDNPLSPDAAHVSYLAAHMQTLYDTGVREPLWVWLIRLFQQASHDPVAAGRLFSLTTSMLLLAVSYWLARAHFRRPFPALLVVLLLAVHSSLVVSSADAHRTELYAIGLVLMAIAAFAPRLRSRCRTAVAVTGSATTMLTQFTGVIPAGAALAWARIVGKVPTRTIGAAISLSAVLILPHAVYTHREFGQAFYFTRTMVPTFFRNYEFLIRRDVDCDGCPTKEQLARDSYSGRPASMFEYLFRLHTVRETVVRTITGYLVVFIVPGSAMASVLGSSSMLLYACYVIGLAFVLFTRARELLLIPIFSINLLAFVIPIGADPRLYLHLAPFAAMIAVTGAFAAARMASRGLCRVARPLLLKS